MIDDPASSTKPAQSKNADQSSMKNLLEELGVASSTSLISMQHDLLRKIEMNKCDANALDTIIKSRRLELERMEELLKLIDESTVKSQSLLSLLECQVCKKQQSQTILTNNTTIKSLINNIDDSIVSYSSEESIEDLVVDETKTETITETSHKLDTKNEQKTFELPPPIIVTHKIPIIQKQSALEDPRLSRSKQVDTKLLNFNTEEKINLTKVSFNQNSSPKIEPFSLPDSIKNILFATASPVQAIKVETKPSVEVQKVASRGLSHETESTTTSKTFTKIQEMLQHGFKKSSETSKRTARELVHIENKGLIITRIKTKQEMFDESQFKSGLLHLHSTSLEAHLCMRNTNEFEPMPKMKINEKLMKIMSNRNEKLLGREDSKENLKMLANYVFCNNNFMLNKKRKPKPFKPKLKPKQPDVFNEMIMTDFMLDATEETLVDDKKPKEEGEVDDCGQDDLYWDLEIDREIKDDSLELDDDRNVSSVVKENSIPKENNPLQQHNRNLNSKSFGDKSCKGKEDVYRQALRRSRSPIKPKNKRSRSRSRSRSFKRSRSRSISRQSTTYHGKSSRSNNNSNNKQRSPLRVSCRNSRDNYYDNKANTSGSVSNKDFDRFKRKRS